MEHHVSYQDTHSLYHSPCEPQKRRSSAVSETSPGISCHTLLRDVLIPGLSEVLVEGESLIYVSGLRGRSGSNLLHGRESGLSVESDNLHIGRELDFRVPVAVVVIEGDGLGAGVVVRGRCGLDLFLDGDGSGFVHSNDGGRPNRNSIGRWVDKASGGRLRWVENESGGSLSTPIVCWSGGVVHPSHGPVEGRRELQSLPVPDVNRVLPNPDYLEDCGCAVVVHILLPGSERPGCLSNSGCFGSRLNGALDILGCGHRLDDLPGGELGVSY